MSGAVFRNPRRSLRISLFMMKLAKVNVTVFRLIYRVARARSPSSQFLQMRVSLCYKMEVSTDFFVGARNFGLQLQTTVGEAIKSSATFPVSCKMASFQLPSALSLSLSLSKLLLLSTECWSEGRARLCFSAPQWRGKSRNLALR